MTTGGTVQACWDKFGSSATSFTGGHHEFRKIFEIVTFGCHDIILNLDWTASFIASEEYWQFSQSRDVGCRAKLVRSKQQNIRADSAEVKCWTVYKKNTGLHHSF